MQLFIRIIQCDTTRDRRLRLKPTLVQDTDYMVEKTYHIAPIFGRLCGSKGVSIFHLVKKPLVLVKMTPKDYMVDKTYSLAPYLGPFCRV